MRYVKQVGLRDCGVCCLLNIIRYYKGNISIDKLREMTNTNENGTSIYNLVKASNKLGFKSKAYKCDINDLHNVKFPIIGYIKLNNFDHFVIINNIDIDKIVIFDPIRGKINYTFEEFSNCFQNIIITFDREGEIVREKDYYTNYLIDLFITNRQKMIITGILSIICTIFTLILSSFVKNIYDASLSNMKLVLFLILILVKVILDYIKINYASDLNNKVSYTLSNKIYTKLFFLPLSYHHNRPVGDITSKINDLYLVEDFISTFTTSSIIDILYIILIIIFILFTNIKLFLIFTFITFFYIFIYYCFKNEENTLIENLKEKYSVSSSLLVDSILGIDSIKNLGIEEKIIDKNNKEKKSYLASLKKYVSFISFENSFFSFVESYGSLVIIYVGYMITTKNKLSIGSLTMIYTLFITYINSLKNIISLDKLLSKSRLSYKNINSLFNYKINDGKKSIKNINKIKFDDVSFSYNGNRLLTNINIEINKGDAILINGRSGIGKSTIFKLLYKEIPISNGNIYINDINLNDIKINSIKKCITYVSQNEYIFNDTIKNNILFYKNVKEKDLNKVLKVTGIDKMLKKRSITLNYILEENGHNLSKGERQRIIIARTLLRNTNYIILDETTNELDFETERDILSNIITEYKKTLVLITHRRENIDLFNKRVEI